MSMAGWLHDDSIDGNPITLGINQPLAAAPELELRRRLRDFQQENDAPYLYLQDELVWGTSMPATLIGPQIIHWPINQESLLVWPLDRSVYSCEIDDSTNFLLVEEGTERVESPVEALERLKKSALPIVMMVGGRQADFLAEEGFPPSPIEQQLSTDVKTSSALKVYTLNRIIHPQLIGIAAGLLVAAGAVTAFYMIREDVEEVSEQVSTIRAEQRKPKGTPALAPQLLTLADTARQLEFLQMHGLKKAVFDKGANSMKLEGSKSNLDERRLRQIASELGMPSPYISATNNWTLSLPVVFEPVESQDLQALDEERSRLMTLAAHATLETTKTEPVADKLFSTVDVNMTAEGFAVTGPMRYLAELLDRQPTPPNVELTKLSMDFDKKGNAKLAMTASIRGLHQEQQP